MIKINLSATLHGVMTPLGPIHQGYDIEGLAIQRDQPDILYGTSGVNARVNNEKRGGYLYRISRLTGAVTSIGSTGFEKVSALAAHPNDDSLWGWARNESKEQQWNGIIKIDPLTGNSVPVKQFDYKQYLVEGLAWSPNGDKLYASGEKGALWVYDPETQELTTACAKVSDGKIEGLDMQPNGILLVGVDKDFVTTILGYDPQRCLVVSQRDFQGVRYDDIESLIWPTKECNDQSWLNAE
jgi:WD40 repeat protein